MKGWPASTTIGGGPNQGDTGRLRTLMPRLGPALLTHLIPWVLQFTAGTSRENISCMHPSIPAWEPLSSEALADQLGTYDRQRTACALARHMD